MRKQYILPNRRPHNPRILRRIRHRPRPPQKHTPVRPIHIANDRAQETRLARADAAHDTDELAFSDCEVYAFEGGGERFGGSGPGEFAVFDGEDLVSRMSVWFRWELEVGWIVWDLRKCCVTYHFTSGKIRLIFDRARIALQLFRIKEILQTSDGDHRLDRVRNLKAY